MAAHVRRSRHVFFTYRESSQVDVVSLLRGTVDVRKVPCLVACSALTGEEKEVSVEDIQLALGLPSDEWVPAGTLDTEEERVRRLVDAGVLVEDDGVEREETLGTVGWHPYAALFHFMTRWRDLDVAPGYVPDVELTKDARSLAERGMELIREEFGVPPGHFYAAPGTLKIHELPVVTEEGPLYELLQRRRTTRSFDRETPTSLAELSTVLRYTFGCHALTPVYEGFTLVSKTSPSGGGLHPIEVYPLIARVDGIESGLYHYSASEHALELLESLVPAEVEPLIEEFTAGQTYLRSAHVLLVLTARFERSFWKYREHEKAYPVVLMDAAHLSQTMYLVCTELGLGAFVTAAINNGNIDERLGIDGFHEGAIAACGLGKPLTAPGLDPSFTPFVPRS